MHSKWIVVLASFVVGCNSNKDVSSTGGKPASSVTSELAPTAAAIQVDLGALADKTLASWLEAQNSGRFDAYAALYDKSFKGVRRTGAGLEKSFDLDGWTADRKKLFGKKQQVAADKVAKRIDGDTITLTFVQRWKSEKAADHGEKVLELRNAGGELRIVREEMKWSERGWDDGKDQPFDATAMVSPITITVDKVRLPDNGDCSASRLRIHFEDAKGTKKDLDYGTITGMGGDATDKGGKLAPKNGEYTDLGVYCAGLQAGYTLKTGGDTLVALEIWNDEESGPGKNSKVVAKLPPGAQIVMK